MEDRSLVVERTILAWGRTGLAALAIGAGTMRVSLPSSSGLAQLVAGTLALLVGIGCQAVALRRSRRLREGGSDPPALAPVGARALATGVALVASVALLLALA